MLPIDPQLYYKSKPNYKKKIIFIVILLILGYFVFGFGFAYKKITIEKESLWSRIGGIFTFNDADVAAEDSRFPLPQKEPDRLDMIILGIRGEDDPNGGLLTDSILIISLDKKTGKTSLVSMPRDLYIDMKGLFIGKINEIYEGGLRKKNSADFTKEIFSRISGTYIDNMVVFDFQSFEKIVDTLGGIEVTLEKPFEEKQQWGYVFYLPEGKNHLNGEQALYYARSRYGTSDFDRARRQQEIILAIKDKISSLGILGNPLKLTALINVFGDSIKTDLGIWDLKDLADLTSSLGATNRPPKRFVMTSENILYEAFQDNIFILLPKLNDYKEIQNIFKNILNQ